MVITPFVGLQESEQQCDSDNSQAESSIELGSTKSMTNTSNQARDSDNDSVGDNDISLAQDDETNLVRLIKLNKIYH